MSKVLKHTGSRLAALAAVAGILGGGFAAGTVLAAEYEVRMPVSKTVRLAPVEEAVDPDADKAKPAAKPAPKPVAKPAEKPADKAGAEKTAPAKPAAEKPAKPEKHAQDKHTADKAAADKAAAEKAPKPVLGKAAEAAANAERKTVIISKKPAKPASKKNVKPVEVSADPDAQDNASAEQAAHAAPPAAAAPSAAVAPTEAQAAPKAAKPAPSVPAQRQPAPVKTDPKALVMPAAATTGTGAPLPADGLWMGEVSVEYQEQSVIVRIATSKQADRLTWFNQAEPRKLAADFHGEWHKKGGHVLRMDTGPIKNIIVGEHPDRMRLAVEFRDGAVNPGVEPKLEAAAGGVTLTIPLAVHLKP
ncbi:AMIN domain-containing protein [Humidesulfovibrio idahonensis]